MARKSFPSILYQVFGFLLSLATAAISQPHLSRSDVPKTGTSIPQSLEVPAFVPPVPKAEEKIPAMRVDAAVTVPSKANHTLTILRGEASTLPDLPLLLESKTQARPPLAPADPTRIKTRQNHMLQFGATIYDHRVSRVHWQRSNRGEVYEALCGFDVSLLQGIGQFTHDGEIYHLMLSPFQFDPTKPSSRVKHPVPDLPDVPPDSITFLKGNPNDPSGTATITLIRDLIAREKSRLTIYQADRLRYQQAAAAWEKAHPPVPRDETVWFRPHRGSQYLANPQADAKRETTR